MRKSHPKILELTANIVSAYVAHNPLPAVELAGVLQRVHEAMQMLIGNQHDPSESPVRSPAVPIRKSITPDYLICLEDGKKYKTLRHTLKAQYGLTPDEYRMRWNLPKDYPMVAPNYSARRSELAKKLGLGRKPGQKAPASRKTKP